MEYVRCKACHLVPCITINVSENVIIKSLQIKSWNAACLLFPEFLGYVYEPLFSCDIILTIVLMCNHNATLYFILPPLWLQTFLVDCFKRLFPWRESPVPSFFLNNNLDDTANSPVVYSLIEFHISSYCSVLCHSQNPKLHLIFF